MSEQTIQVKAKKDGSAELKQGENVITVGRKQLETVASALAAIQRRDIRAA